MTSWKEATKTIVAGLAICTLIPSTIVTSQNPVKAQLLGPAQPGLKGLVGATGSQGPAGPGAKSTRATTDTSGGYTWTYPSACLNGGNVPSISAIAEGPTPQNSFNVNVQIEGVPSATVANFRVTKTQNTTVALLGLTITVSVVGTSIGTTVLDLTCIPQ